MAEFSETTTYSVACPACQSDRVVKDGSQSGEQRYRCKDCPKWFRAGGKAEGQKMDAQMVGSAIRDIYSGKSFKANRRGPARRVQLAQRAQQGHDLRVGPGLHQQGRRGNEGPQGPDRQGVGCR